MKNIQIKAVLALLSGTLLFASCDKNDEGSLSGPVPQGTFTTTSKTVGLTTQVTFTADANSDAFQYAWDFGDGTQGVGQTVNHTYTKGGNFQVQLITSSRGGTGLSEKKEVVIPSTLNIVKQFLTGGSSKTWVLNDTTNAPIVVGPSDEKPTEYYAGGVAGSLPKCQSDDEYTFSMDNVYSYNAKVETLVGGSGGGCQAPRTGTTPFTFEASTGVGVAQLTLANAGSFIAVTDAPGMTYRILDITDKTMLLRAGSTAQNLTFTFKLVAK